MSSVCSQPYSLFQGESKLITLTVLKKDGTAQNLTGATVEFQVKPKAGDADTALVIDKSSATAGITILDQTVGADTEGQAEIAIDPSDTSGQDAGQYEYDIVVILSGGARYYVVPPSPFIILDVVNLA